jgi:SAM-dependent methyltransferase
MSKSDLTSHFEAQKFFDKIAENYTARSKTAVYNLSSLSFRRRQDMVIRRLLETPAGGTVLDYGMGPAVFGPPATSNGLRYLGLDISPRMVQLAQDMNLPNSEYHVGDLDLLKKFTTSADTVLLIGLIDYLEDPATGLKELAKCVKPNGRLIMSFRNRRSIPRILRDFAKEIWRSAKTMQKEADTAFAAPVLENSFAPHRDLIPLLKAAGFEHVKVDYLDCSPIFFNLALPRSLWELGRKFDAMLSCRTLSFMCASGVLVASNKR